MPIQPLGGDLTAGVANAYSETINASPDPFVTGDVPAILGTDEIVATNQVIPIYTAVSFNGSGELIPAVLGTAEAIGILMISVDTTGLSGVGAPVWRMGCFNPEIILWDATYTTDAEKQKAFEGAPSPTAIVIRAPRTLTV